MPQIFSKVLESYFSEKKNNINNALTKSDDMYQNIVNLVEEASKFFSEKKKIPLAKIKSVVAEFVIAKIKTLGAIEDTICYDSINSLVKFRSTLGRLASSTVLSENSKYLVSEAIENAKYTKINHLTVMHLQLFSNVTNKELQTDIFEALLNNAKILQDMQIEIPIEKSTKQAIKNLLALHDVVLNLQTSNPNLKESLRDYPLHIIRGFQKVLNASDALEFYDLLHINKNKPSTMSKNITVRDEKFLELADRLTKCKIKGNKEESKYLARILAECINNKKANAKWLAFSREKTQFSKKYQAISNDIKYLSFKTRYINLNMNLLKKCQLALQNIDNKKPVNKLNLFEFGQLENLSKIKDRLNKYNDAGIIAQSPALLRLYRQSVKAANFITSIYQKIYAEPILKNGDILMVNSKSFIYKNRKAVLEESLTQAFISKYFHAMQIYREPNSPCNALSVSHVLGSYGSANLNLGDFLTSDCFRVNPMNLIPDNLRKKFKNVENDIVNTYQKNIQELIVSSKIRFAPIKNSTALRFKAGLADLGLFGGHKNKIIDQPEKIYNTMYGNKGYTIKNKKICSQFVAECILAAVFKTNADLAKKFQEKEVLRMPFQNEELKRVHPQRLIQVLKKEGCLEEIVTPSNILSALVDQKNETKEFKHVAKTMKPVERLYKEIVTLSKQCGNDKNLFINKAIKSFKHYAIRENLDVSFRNPAVKNHLDTSLGRLHKQLNKSAPAGFLAKFVAWLGSIAKWLGLTSDKNRKTIETALHNLEKVQYDTIKKQYAKPSSIKSNNSLFFGDKKIPAHKSSEPITRRPKN